MPVPFADLDLARRLERTEAHAGRQFIEARARLFPERGSTWIEVGGAYALFDGVDAPTTQTFGLGMFEPPSVAHLSQLESFFEERGADTFHEVSPLADPSTFGVLAARGYVPFEFTSVMYRTLDELHDGGPVDVQVRLMKDGEQDAWGAMAAAGWSELPELSAFMLEFGRMAANLEDGRCFLVDVDGVPAATGMLVLHQGIALFAGASTIPAARRRGAQRALVNARLRYAVNHGCDLAMMCALPGSTSQRNAERHGFRIAYTRIKWRRNLRTGE